MLSIVLINNPLVILTNNTTSPVINFLNLAQAIKNNNQTSGKVIKSSAGVTIAPFQNNAIGKSTTITPITSVMTKIANKGQAITVPTNLQFITVALGCDAGGWLMWTFDETSIATIPTATLTSGLYVSVSQTITNNMNNVTVALIDATQKVYAYGTYQIQSNFTAMSVGFNMHNTDHAPSATQAALNNVPVDGTVVLFTTTPAITGLITIAPGQTLSSFVYRAQFSDSMYGNIYSDLVLSAANLALINALLAAGTSITINISMLNMTYNFQATIQALNATTNTVVCSQVFKKVSSSTQNNPGVRINPDEALPKTGQVLYQRTTGTGTPPAAADATAQTGIVGSYTKQPWPTNGNLTEYAQSFLIQTTT